MVSEHRLDPKPAQLWSQGPAQQVIVTLVKMNSVGPLLVFQPYFQATWQTEAMPTSVFRALESNVHGQDTGSQLEAIL